MMPLRPWRAMQLRRSWLLMLALLGVFVSVSWVRVLRKPAFVVQSRHYMPSQAQTSSQGTTWTNKIARTAEDKGTGDPQKRLLVLGGGGYVGREVCKLAIERGFKVTSLTRRGENPEPDDERLAAVTWVKGSAADPATVKKLADDSDAVAHTIGLLFDVNSGLTNLNTIVSGSNSLPGEESTYDLVTRQTAFNLIDAVNSRFRLPGTPPTPFVFTSAAEAGWPEVSFGEQVEKVAPEWLKRYLKAKRMVEGKITATPETIRPIIYRPSLIWSWTKFDVLPVIPIFNLLSAVGVPFVDKTVTVTTLARAMVAGLEDDTVSGVQRFMQMEELEQKLA
eukprot:CAMPEP_0172722652 /NCGR_PEP_ID=MMETSP1074-20121228/81984_1 /TAXON_ID=2916 /ORGANISM="Ceratium fusus, Strain PA161109" /LENGTH=334 /DNA_ID=CAMNT_0013548705 /DNA_START=44 /DNA_END=1048 /DNA_ORIENTATION=-